MANKAQKKEFALAQIAPYFKNPSTCGFDTEDQVCRNITDDGKMCVAGKNMIDPIKYSGSITMILEKVKQQKMVFKPEAVGKLTTDEWQKLQNIHDAIATKKELDEFKVRITRLNLFTYEELVEYAEKLT